MMKLMFYMEGETKMKRFLVLLMVLSMVTVANAGMCTLLPNGETSMAIGSTLTIAVMSGDATAQGLAIELDDTAAGALAQTGVYSYGDWIYTGGTDMGMTQYAAAGGMASISDPVAQGYPGFFVLSGAGVPPTAPTAGEWFSIVYKCLGVGDTYITLYDSGASELSQLLVHQTPEPMTMCLLGLGGLFLRRRSK
jgi:hypothetical protein